jgi:hypothetical protein
VWSEERTCLIYEWKISVLRAMKGNMDIDRMFPWGRDFSKATTMTSLGSKRGFFAVRRWRWNKKFPVQTWRPLLGASHFPPFFYVSFGCSFFFVVGKLHMLEWRTNDILGREQILFIIIVHIKLIYLDWILMGILEGLAC